MVRARSLGLLCFCSRPLRCATADFMVQAMVQVLANVIGRSSKQWRWGVGTSYKAADLASSPLLNSRHGFCEGSQSL